MGEIRVDFQDYSFLLVRDEPGPSAFASLVVPKLLSLCYPWVPSSGE